MISENSLICLQGMEIYGDFERRKFWDKEILSYKVSSYKFLSYEEERKENILAQRKFHLSKVPLNQIISSVYNFLKLMLIQRKTYLIAYIIRSGLKALNIHNFCSDVLFFHSCGNFSFSGHSLSMNFFQRLAEPSMSRSRLRNSSMLLKAYVRLYSVESILYFKSKIFQWIICSSDILIDIGHFPERFRNTSWPLIHLLRIPLENPKGVYQNLRRQRGLTRGSMKKKKHSRGERSW